MYPAVFEKLRCTHLPAWAANTEQRRLAARQLWAISAGASRWLIDLEPYEYCRVVGVVRSMRVDPSEGYIGVTINDGTAEVVARWSIRRPAPELALVPGTEVVLDGVVAVGDDGRPILQEPEFQALSYPASG
ncbi:MAG: hypothetical protein ACRDJL_12550 [Actinomycetota bacterium]